MLFMVSDNFLQHGSCCKEPALSSLKTSIRLSTQGPAIDLLLSLSLDGPLREKQSLVSEWLEGNVPKK